jgi:hypothetical protein
MLAGGLGVFAAADANYLWETANGASTTGLTSTFWLVGLAMLAASAWLPARAVPAPDGIGGLALLIAGSLTSLGILAAGSAFAIGALATILAVAALAMVLLRLVLTHGENARLLLQLRREANTDAPSEDHPDLPISCSAGAALIPLDGNDLRTVLLVADARMYANKAQRPELALAGG